MCLSIPAKVEKIEGEYAEVTVGGVTYKAGLQLLDDVKPGDYILLHAGFALQKISDKEARETLLLFQELDALNEQTDAQEKGHGHDDLM